MHSQTINMNKNIALHFSSSHLVPLAHGSCNQICGMVKTKGRNEWQLRQARWEALTINAQLLGRFPGNKSICEIVESRNGSIKQIYAHASKRVRAGRLHGARNLLWFKIATAFRHNKQKRNRLPSESTMTKHFWSRCRLSQGFCFCKTQHPPVAIHDFLGKHFHGERRQRIERKHSRASILVGSHYFLMSQKKRSPSYIFVWRQILWKTPKTWEWAL